MTKFLSKRYIKCLGVALGKALTILPRRRKRKRRKKWRGRERGEEREEKEEE